LGAHLALCRLWFCVGDGLCCRWSILHTYTHAHAYTHKNGVGRVLVVSTLCIFATLFVFCVFCTPSSPIWTIPANFFALTWSNQCPVLIFGHFLSSPAPLARTCAFFPQPSFNRVPIVVCRMTPVENRRIRNSLYETLCLDTCNEHICKNSQWPSM
jgi:hypothetical protein